MPLRKHGSPEPMQPDQERPQKQGSANFTEEDREALRRENDEADAPSTEE